MKVIIKNGIVMFQRSMTTELEPTNTINSCFVGTNGSVSTASPVMWVDVYKLNAGETYLIQGDDDWNAGTTLVTLNTAIGTGTNHLTTLGPITNFNSLYTITPGSTEKPSVTISPNANCYLYVTNVDETPTRTTRKLVSVFTNAAQS